MSWISQTLTSSLGRKLIMALTGLFLCSFLVIHLTGNLQLLYNDQGKAFNEYAKFMTTFSLIKFLSYGLYAGFLIHILDGLFLTFSNKQARPVGYKKSSTENASWASKNMGLLGSIIFVFLVIHLKNFWYEMHFGDLPMMEGTQTKDLYQIVVKVFKEPAYLALYLVSMIALAYHLLHGFQSAFQTLGLNHFKYTPLIKGFGFVFSILIPAAFAAIPLILFLKP